MAVSARRRALGQYFTPAWLARQVVADALASLADDHSALSRPATTDSRALKVLDPAAGEGAFLLAVLDVYGVHEASRDIARLDIAGCEIDANVLTECRRQISSRLNQSNIGNLLDSQNPHHAGSCEFTSEELSSTRVRLVHGNAVTGADWTLPNAALNAPPPISTPDPTFDAPVNAAAIDWTAAFPDVAAAGGFDLVVGNPPFVRELGSKQLLAGVAASEWCARYRQPRMDLSQYFVHRALNLLRPGGVLAFILPEYWLSGSSGRRLRQRLATECTLQQIVVLGKWPLFAGVFGRHVVLQVRKTPASIGATCIVRRIVEPAPARLDFEQAVLVQNDSKTLDSDGSCPVQHPRIESYSTLWCNRLFIDQPLPVENVAPADGASWNVHGSNTDQQLREAVSPTTIATQSNLDSRRVTTTLSSFGSVELGHLFDVRQGIAENPPVVTKAMASESRDSDNPLNDSSGSPSGDQRSVTLGGGVFVLSKGEVDALELSPLEQSLLRPYFVPRDFQPFAPPTHPERWLLYLTEKTAPDIAALPHVRQHLQRFKRWLDQRREVQLGRIAWWHLHWPRQERLFIEPRIIGLQMSREPTFAWMTAPSFVGFSCHVIAPTNAREPKQSNSAVPGAPRNETFSLPALTGLLNSDFAADWFERNAKKRGIRWDISGSVLRRFPLPPFDSEHNVRLTQLVQALQSRLSSLPHAAETARETPRMASLADRAVPTSESAEIATNAISGPPSRDQSAQLLSRQNRVVNALKLAGELRSEISQAVNAWYAEGAKTIIR